MDAFDWDALNEYSSKEETRIDGPWCEDPERLKRMKVRAQAKADAGKPQPEPLHMKLWRESPLKWWKLMHHYLTKIKPHSRQIIWVTDTKGHSGKTTFQKIMSSSINALRFGACSARDGMHLLANDYAQHGARLVYMFDITRTTAESMPLNDLYHLCEMLKDCTIRSEKYQGIMIELPYVPHVLVFANHPPDWTKLSHDRIKEWVIDEQAPKSNEVEFDPAAIAADMLLEEGLAAAPLEVMIERKMEQDAAAAMVEMPAQGLTEQKMVQNINEVREQHALLGDMATAFREANMEEAMLDSLGVEGAWRADDEEEDWRDQDDWNDDMPQDVCPVCLGCGCPNCQW